MKTAMSTSPSSPARHATRRCSRSRVFNQKLSSKTVRMRQREKPSSRSTWSHMVSVSLACSTATRVTKSTSSTPSSISGVTAATPRCQWLVRSTDLWRRPSHLKRLDERRWSVRTLETRVTCTTRHSLTSTATVDSRIKLS